MGIRRGFPSRKRGSNPAGKASGVTTHAVALLTRARAAGLFQAPARAAHLKRDRLLDALRDRVNFRKLLEGLP